ncbi:NADP-dependent oxidoreductase [Aquimarina sp. 2-A2]|uniref:NADP-dependent oxidoreductase n=1 Tax=Aquimarina sp. 2-A2 TaxID=3382644 RepID=UPI00387F01BB
MNTYTNRQWIYRKRPENVVDERHYSLQTTSLSTTELKENQVVLKSKYFSLDPYMRIQQSALETWERPHPLDTVQGGAVVGQIQDIHPSCREFKVGDWVLSYAGWQEYAIADISGLRKLNRDEVPLTTALGILGMPARVAYFGLQDVGQPKPGETVVVSGASGAVGQIVTQIAKIKGCHVIGIAGSDEKTKYLKETLQLDGVINYKKFTTQKEIHLELKRLAPQGVDIYYDNVGGYITDAVIDSINTYARIIICGQISQYSDGLDSPNLGPRFLHKMLYKRAKIQGVLARDYNNRMPELLEEMTPWVQQGLLHYKETIVNGFENLPKALNMLFYGKNTGKLIVEV